MLLKSVVFNSRNFAQVSDVYEHVNRLSLTQSSIPPRKVNRVPACLVGDTAGRVHLCSVAYGRWCFVVLTWCFPPFNCKPSIVGPTCAGACSRACYCWSSCPWNAVWQSVDPTDHHVCQCVEQPWSSLQSGSQASSSQLRRSAWIVSTVTTASVCRCTSRSRTQRDGSTPRSCSSG